MRVMSVIYRDRVEINGTSHPAGTLLENIVLHPGDTISNPRCAFAEGQDDKGVVQVFKDDRTDLEREGVYEEDVAERERAARKADRLKVTLAQEAALKDATLQAISTGKIQASPHSAAIAAAAESARTNAESAKKANAKSAAGKPKGKSSAAPKSF